MNYLYELLSNCERQAKENLADKNLKDNFIKLVYYIPNMVIMMKNFFYFILIFD